MYVHALQYNIYAILVTLFFLNFFFAFAKCTIIIFFFGVQFVHADVFMLILFQTRCSFPCIYSCHRTVKVYTLFVVYL